MAVYVVEGALIFFWGSEKKAAGAGSYFYQPRGIPHGFRVEGDTPARILYMTFPAGVDRFVVEKEAVVGSFFFQPRGIPHGFRVEGDTPARILYMTFPAGIDRFVIEQGQLAPDCESVTAAARYKIEIIGPLPE